MTTSFDREAHAYYIDGILVPSVTTILAPATDFSRIPTATLENARDRGDKLAKAINLFNRDALDWDSIDEGTADGVRGWERALDKLGATVVESERPVYHKLMRYAGTPDAVLQLRDGRFAIPDVKATYEIPRTVGPQTAAYAEAWSYERKSTHGARGTKPRRLCVHIRNGEPTIRWLHAVTDWSVFVSFLTVHNYLEGTP